MEHMTNLANDSTTTILMGMCKECGEPIRFLPPTKVRPGFWEHTESMRSHAADPDDGSRFAADRSRNGALVHEARSSGRDLRIVAYLEGGERPVVGHVTCRTQQQAEEIARVLTEARSS